MRKIIYIFLLLSFAACTDERLYEENKFITNSTLNTRDRIAFEFDIQDTVTNYDLYTNLRITSEYPYSNIFLLVTATNPEGKVMKELIEFTLADITGKWYGRGLGDIYDFRILHDRFKDFPMKKAGRYKFEFNQVMRVNDLKGISAIGMRVLKH